MNNLKLPAVTEVQRFRPEPGDRYVLHLDCDSNVSTMEMANEIARRFRAVMKLPDDAPIAVFARGLEIEITNDACLRFQMS